MHEMSLELGLPVDEVRQFLLKRWAPLFVG